jgi:hypothetical protein
MQELKFSVKSKEYVVEFGFRATQCKELNSVFDFLTGKTIRDSISKSNGEENERQSNMILVEAGIQSMAESNRYVMDFLYMGLVKNHGAKGKISQDILSRDDTIDLYEEFIEENPTHELSSTLGLLEALKSKMESDGFFKLTGVDKMMEEMSKDMSATEKKTNVTEAKEEAKKSVRKTVK